MQRSKTSVIVPWAQPVTNGTVAMRRVRCDGPRSAFWAIDRCPLARLLTYALAVVPELGRAGRAASAALYYFFPVCLSVFVTYIPGCCSPRRLWPLIGAWSSLSLDARAVGLDDAVLATRRSAAAASRRVSLSGLPRTPMQYRPEHVSLPRMIWSLCSQSAVQKTFRLHCKQILRSEVLKVPDSIGRAAANVPRTNRPQLKASPRTLSNISVCINAKCSLFSSHNPLCPMPRHLLQKTHFTGNIQRPLSKLLLLQFHAKAIVRLSLA